ncbi:uncharacterized protein K452DRAFT_271034 [Aplosporella prunicola CBS 121167]|uniref:Transcription initiation factor TFIID subunit 8 n=1 Tax=Aplosporella prunicola CBS 121167 TaxID=1176127 RepID=A0A6A6BG46_9PEZI|nr:uncharacterized protein K452DRAFT_271034 [Aplosporella prunicola CBS 121167]KAF2142214.1 hypothetical protein K452DRAFT_271034 [Aplosporella prunicola CBS 121167]
MPGVRYPDSSAAGSKRPFADDDNAAYAHPPKRTRTVRHALHHRQQWHADPTLAPQDEAFFQSQLLRAISIALAAAGFEGAKPTALEAFRAQVDEYMRHFLSDVRTSMQHSRRATPVPQDFSYALTHTGYSSSTLEPQTSLPIPTTITQPPLPAPPPHEPAPPDLDAVLGPALSGAADKAAREYIPAHLPAFPSKHTWQATPVYSARETDPRRIRERATQEGVLAEQALRKLMAANRGGGSRASGGRGRSRGSGGGVGAAKAGARAMWEDAMREVLREEGKGAKDSAGDLVMGGMDGSAGVAELRKEPAADDEGRINGGLLVNYDKKYWRKGTQTAAWS